jgi:hypothetical protein
MPMTGAAGYQLATWWSSNSAELLVIYSGKQNSKKFVREQIKAH